MKSLIAVTVMALSLNAFATEKKEELKADRDAVNSSCSSEAQTAGCGSEKVGTGLLKCLHSYKKEHKEFKFSDSCKASMKKLHQDKKSK